MHKTCVHFLLAALLVTPFASADDKYGARRPAIYDTSADANAEIKLALRRARPDNKRVLLMFGANWCTWCHLLHDLFKEDDSIYGVLHAEYELVLVDVDRVNGMPNNAAVQERYGNPARHGLPVLVVLAADGRQLTTQETGSLEDGDHHDPAKVLAFLEKWKAPRQSAKSVLKSAVRKADSKSKLVFLTLSSPHCPYCASLSAFLADSQVARVFDEAFILAKIDVERMKGGKEVAERLGWSATDDGTPFFVILDAKENVVAHSRSRVGNIGFPTTPKDVEFFLKAVRKAKKLSGADLKLLETKLLKGRG